MLLATSPRLFFRLLAILCIIGFCAGLAISLLKKKRQKSLCPESFQIHQEDKAHKKDGNFKHFLKEHVWGHIVKKHLPSVFLWSFGALILCGILTEYINIEDWITGHEGYMPLVVLAAAVIGLIPQSGPRHTTSLKFDKVVHNFGKILAGSGEKKCQFKYTNVSSEPVVINNILSSCGCSVPEWNKAPIRPGESGVITVTFLNDQGAYPFDKTLTVYVSSSPKPIQLRITDSCIKLSC